MAAGHPLASREDVKEKVAWEGGLVAAMEYGLTEQDMPEGDEELRAAWTKLRYVWLAATLLAGDVERILGVIIN